MKRERMPRHLRKLLVQFPDARVRRTRNGHWLIETPCGSRIIESSTPSDRRGALNTLARLRRAFRKTR